MTSTAHHRPTILCEGDVHPIIRNPFRPLRPLPSRTTRAQARKKCRISCTLRIAIVMTTCRWPAHLSCQRLHPVPGAAGDPLRNRAPPSLQCRPTHTRKASTKLRRRGRWQCPKSAPLKESRQRRRRPSGSRRLQHLPRLTPRWALVPRHKRLPGPHHRQLSTTHRKQLSTTHRKQALLPHRGPPDAPLGQPRMHALHRHQKASGGLGS